MHGRRGVPCQWVRRPRPRMRLGVLGSRHVRWGAFHTLGPRGREGDAPPPPRAGQRARISYKPFLQSKGIPSADKAGVSVAPASAPPPSSFQGSGGRMTHAHGRGHVPWGCRVPPAACRAAREGVSGSMTILGGGLPGRIGRCRLRLVAAPECIPRAVLVLPPPGAIVESGGALAFRVRPRGAILPPFPMAAS